MKKLLLAAMLLVSSVVFADAASPPDAFVVSADQWAQQRSGAALLRLQPIQGIVQEWLAQPDSHIVVRHAASDAGNLWAGELQDWLVSLGIPSDHIDKQASADQPDDSVTLLVQHP
ncbi:MAG TPA: hypothetical protein VGM16_10215 [Gammaproteobacteria bacterium]|jgi:hypothetical protein